MKKMTRMTFNEARKYVEENNDKLQAAYDSAPVVDDGFADMDVKPIARGFAEFKEYINKNGRPKVEDPKVSISIRIPLSYAEKLRATGRGWQTRLSEYMVAGIKKGELGNIKSEKTALNPQ